jgi:hypothetical protein
VSTWTLPECSVATSVANAVANAAAVDAAKAVHEANLAVESAQKKEQDTEQNQTAYVASTSYDEQEYIPCEVECEEECKVDNANISIKKDSLNEDYLSYINSMNYSEPEILYNTSFKTVFPKESEHIFRNCCLKILHGKIPSYSVWGQLDYFDVTYWDGFDEHQCYQLVSSLWHNYSKDYKDLTERINILHANIPADISASNNTYNYILKDIVSWLFS